MKWLSDQLEFKSNNSFPVNPYEEYPQIKKENKIPDNNTNTSESIWAMMQIIKILLVMQKILVLLLKLIKKKKLMKIIILIQINKLFNLNVL